MTLRAATGKTTGLPVRASGIFQLRRLPESIQVYFPKMILAVCS